MVYKAVYVIIYSAISIELRNFEISLNLWKSFKEIS